MDRDTFTALAVITTIAVIAPLLSELVKGRVPSVVLELLFGIIVGPQVLALAKITPAIAALAAIGLTFLFFMAGYEIDMPRIRGRPLTLAVAAWFIGLAVALVIATTLVITGYTLSTLLIALAITTTALGTLLPMLEDAGELHSRFGATVLAIGGAGEFLPIVAITLLLSGHSPFGTGLLLIAFVALAAGAAALALRPTPHRIALLLGRTLNTSSQLPIRIAVLMVVLLGWVASQLGLDVLLGAFAAGAIVRLASGGPEAETARIRLETIGYGVFVPVFFVATGLSFDLGAVERSPRILLGIPALLLAMLLVRGAPVLLYRGTLSGPERRALAFFSATGLPMIVVITAIGVQAGHMWPGTAAALVAAGMISVFIYPIIGLALLRRWQERRPARPGATRSTGRQP